MADRHEVTPTILGYSEGELGVIAGGGINGYGGVMLHEPTDLDFRRISHDLDEATKEPKGVGFDYSDVATITLSGILRWTNFNLERAPTGRQDLREAGRLRIELFDSAELRDYLESRSRMLGHLGINFIGM